MLYAKEEIEGKNELIAQMLSVMEPLVSHGFYWEDSEINEIIGVLTDIVNGIHDQPYPGKDYINNICLLSLSFSLLGAHSRKVDKYQQKKRFKATERTKKIFQVKNRLVTMIIYQPSYKLYHNFLFIAELFVFFIFFSNSWLI